MSLAHELVTEYHEELVGRRPCSAEQALMNDFKRLDENAHELVYYLQNGAECCELKRALLTAQRTFQCADNRAGNMNVCSCVSRLMNRVDQTLDSIGDEGFESGGGRYVEPRPRYEGNDHHHAERRDEEDRRYDDRRNDRNGRVSEISSIVQGLLRAIPQR